MKEFIQNLFQGTNDRLRNPFVFSFLAALVAVNWRALVVLCFADDRIYERVEWVDQNRHPVWLSIGAPILIALAYVIILPYVSMFIDFATKRGSKERRNIAEELKIHDIESSIRIAKKDAELEQTRASYRDVATLNENIELLQSQLVDKDQVISDLNVQLEKAKDEISKIKSTPVERDLFDIHSPKGDREKDRSEFLNFLKGELGAYFRQNALHLRRYSTMKTRVSDLVIEKLKRAGVINEHSDERGNLYYTLTEKGDRFTDYLVDDMDVPKE